MWKVEKVSRWEDNFFYYFAVCQNKTHGKILFCRVSQKNTRQSISLLWAKKKHTVKSDFVVCFIFAMCFFKYTWQNLCLPCARELAHDKL